jgi:hypothetical protein
MGLAVPGESGDAAPMIDFLMLMACALTRLFRSRARLEAEILALLSTGLSHCRVGSQ